MRKVSRSDIVLELIDLCRELLGDVTLQLNYYRASAYKREAAAPIQQRVAQMRVLAELVAGEAGLEPFLDFEASAGNGNVAVAPGECAFSARVLALVGAARAMLADAERASVQAVAAPEDAFTALVRKHKRELADICPPGSRPWHLLQGL